VDVSSSTHGRYLARIKSTFGQNEILVIGHLYKPYGRKPSPAKVDAMKEPCELQEIRKCLRYFAFYYVWIPHYAHIADPLFQLLRKK
jgi:hypothetical protein